MIGNLLRSKRWTMNEEISKQSVTGQGDSALTYICHKFLTIKQWNSSSICMMVMLWLLTGYIFGNDCQRISHPNCDHPLRLGPLWFDFVLEIQNPRALEITRETMTLLKRNILKIGNLDGSSVLPMPIIWTV